jgi:YHS domain-containing protein
MRAKARQHLCVFAAMAAFLAAASLVSGAPALASAGLPAGLPALPQVGERMLVDRISGIALDGYDPVAYQLAGQPVAGLAAHEGQWAGVTWRFSSAANHAAFMAEPERFAPQFEGYDPTGVSLSRVVESDPYEFIVLRGQLYLFRNGQTKRRFAEDARVLQQAEASWPQVVRQLAR